jgi:hypothetical protein
VPPLAGPAWLGKDPRRVESGHAVAGAERAEREGKRAVTKAHLTPNGGCRGRSSTVIKDRRNGTSRSGLGRIWYLSQSA